MERKVLDARVREDKGKGAARRLRAQGRLPAIMYDERGESTPIDVSESEFNKIFRVMTKTTTLDIKLDSGRKALAFVKDFQHDIITDTVRHVDFYEVDPGKSIRTKMRVKVTGAPESVRLGGALETGISEIEIECLPNDLPERVTVDVTSLGLGESILVKDLALGTGVKILTELDAPVASVRDTRASSEGEREASGA